MKDFEDFPVPDVATIAQLQELAAQAAGIKLSNGSVVGPPEDFLKFSMVYSQMVSRYQLHCYHDWINSQDHDMQL